MAKVFYTTLVNSLIAALTNNFVWFAVTFWVYLQTRSVLATSMMAGIYVGTVAISGFFLGSLVDQYRKKTAMLLSSYVSLILYTFAYILFVSTPSAIFSNVSSIALWIFIVLTLMGAIAGNIRTIALPTLVTLLIPEAERDQANGLVGTANGVSFLIASIFSGLAIGFLGVYWVLVGAIALSIAVILHLTTLHIPEQRTAHTEHQTKNIDLRGTVRAIRLVPGLFGLIFFNCFNNFLGGVFMSLMDAYGLSLVSVQIWGLLWGILSLGFIVGGLLVARNGLGKSPLKTLFVANIAMWIIAAGFTIQASVGLLAVGMFMYLCLIPVVEAAEQTILQTVIPLERQGRVFGVAQSIEQAASPLTAFMIGPIAQFIFIPFMTTGAGADLIGGWFGTGTDRGIALLFTVTGCIGLVVTLMAMRSRSYRKLSINYQKLYKRSLCLSEK
ncbi:MULTISPECIES: MFS transporter [unclassified Leptolyngbya]|uniref:MFS transporter n=1 Tax=unclassified Leptolyngbya TaxID=2650499 RepID=UPI00168500CA|nr:MULTISPECIES: MFS transporter [unclassified Leptolyngbya]MBD1909334.1 MFS transporter [Leptolyngbya sp. FACHB-8]MBD2158192.1 MFS transporter [Leptolyngbya sp. FACHB-16]